MKIYVGNLSFTATEEEIRSEFSAFGTVESVAVPSDRLSGRPRGFAFVEMGSKTEADAAIAGLNGKTLKDRTLVVSESRPREEGRGGSSSGRRTSGGYGSGGSYGGGKQRRY